MLEKCPIRGIISIHAIPDWTDEELAYWWMPECERGDDGLMHIVRPARMSDEAKAQRLVMQPVENMLTNTGVTLFITNNSVSGQGSMYPLSQILSVGNGTFTGATRALTSVAGDGFTTGARKAPASNSTVGFLSTIVFNYGTTDAVGTWTNGGLYGYNTGSSQNATTTTGTGNLVTIASLPFVKGSTAYAVNYALLLQN